MSSLLRVTGSATGGNHVLLFGPRGTGKTTVASASTRKEQNVYSVTLTSEQSAASLWGHYIPQGDRFVYQPGPVLQAWLNGGLLVINEIDHASEDVSNLLHVVLDNPSVAQVTLPTGETVRPAKGFRCIATMNGQVEDLAPAVVDRFSVALPVLIPSTEMLDVLPEDVRREAEWQYSRENRFFRAQNGEPLFTYRMLHAFAELRTSVGDATAARLVCGDASQPEHADMLLSHLAGDSTSKPEAGSAAPFLARDDHAALLRKSGTEQGGRHVLLYGPRGTGKTTVANASAREGQEVFSVTLTAEQSAAALWGHYVPVGDRFVYQPGAVLRAWQSGGLLVINEIDHASEDVSNLLHVVLDNPAVASVTLPTGETVRPAKGFRCIATMNGTAEDLAPAVLDRFTASISVDEPSKEMLEALPQDVRSETQWLYSGENDQRSEGQDPVLTYRTMKAFSLLRPIIGEEEAAVVTCSDPLFPGRPEKLVHALDAGRKGDVDGKMGRLQATVDILEERLQETRTACDMLNYENAAGQRSGEIDEHEYARRSKLILDTFQPRLQQSHLELNAARERLAVARRSKHVLPGTEKVESTFVLDRNRQEEILTAARHLPGGDHVLLYGPRGTGKTTMAAAALAKDQEVFSVTLTSEQSAAALWGHFVPVGDRFVFQPGPVLRAWQSGGLLVINEIDHASEDVSNLLHVALDNPEVASVTLPTGETVRPKPGFRAIATMNGSMDDLAPAVLDRFPVVMATQTPSVEMYALLPDDVRKVAEFQYSSENPSRAANGDPAITFRELLDFSRLRHVVPEKTAAVLACKGSTPLAHSLMESIAMGRAASAVGDASKDNSSPSDELAA